MRPADPVSFWHRLDSWDGESLPGLSGRQLGRRIGDAARLVAARSDPALAVLLGNDTDSVVALLAGLRAGRPILILAPDLPAAEVARACALAGAATLMRGGREPDFTTVAAPPSPPPLSEGVVLMSSGSTGLPKPVGRSLASLLDEAERYRVLLGLSAADSVCLPVPLAHSYALGWLFAALVSQAAVRPVAPQALGETAARLVGGASIVALTPALARLLARRGPPPGGATGVRPRCVMVGAGPVDAELDRSFRAAFGIGLARNYGSTETGALFAGPEGLPPACIGTAMPGVRYRLRDDAGAPVAAGEPGLLDVAVPGGWHAMGDIVIGDGAGRLTVIGRRSHSVRRGDRWISPAEIEAALRACPGVEDAAVRAGRGRAGGERLIAEVVPRPGHDRSKPALLAALADRLAAHKLPDTLHLRRSIRRSSSGKPTAFPVYAPGTAADLGAAARAYKRSELLFALISLGVFDDLDGTADLEEIAHRRGLSLDAFEAAMEVAHRLGLVRPATGAAPAATAAAPFLALEAGLSRSLLTRDTVADVLRRGLADRAFEQAPLPDGLTAIYAAAMHGDAARLRTLLALRRAAPPRGGRMLELSAGPGRYCLACLRRDPALRATLVQVGRLCPPPAAAEDRLAVTAAAPDGVYDFVAVANAIHGPAPGGDLSWLLARVAPGGTLLVDDLFLPPDGGADEIALDWLTHGGIAYPRRDDLLQALALAGWRADCPPVPAEDPLHSIIIAREETS